MRIFTSLAVAILLAGYPMTSDAAPMEASAVAVQGDAILVSGMQQFPLTVGDPVSEGNRIVTGPGGTVEVEFATGDRIRIDEKSDLTVRALRKEKEKTTTIFGLSFGKVRSFIARLLSSESRFEYHTKAAIAGVAGTDFVTEVPEPDSMLVYVLPKEEDGIDCGEEGPVGGRVKVTAFDDARTTVTVSSCYMISVLAGYPPGAPQPLPDELLFTTRDRLPFSVFLPDPGVMMLDNVQRQVSIPLANPTQMQGGTLQELDTQYDQGRGVSTSLSQASMGAGGGGDDGLVHGTITINLGQ